MSAFEEIAWWRSRLVELTREWEASRDEAAPFSDVEEWSRELATIEARYRRMRAEGQWLRGREDFFGVARISRSELHHSRLLKWLADPLGRHGLGDWFLRGFLTHCFQDEEFGDLSGSRGFLEVWRDHRRADIVLDATAIRVVIENKVDAPEGLRQCDELYELFCNEADDTRFVFLTPRGIPPRCSSPEAAEAWVTMSYVDVAAILRAALDNAPNNPHAAGRPVAENYLITLEQEFL